MVLQRKRFLFVLDYRNRYIRRDYMLERWIGKTVWAFSKKVFGHDMARKIHVTDIAYGFIEFTFEGQVYLVSTVNIHICAREDLRSDAQPNTFPSPHGAE